MELLQVGVDERERLHVRDALTDGAGPFTTLRNAEVLQQRRPREIAVDRDAKGLQQFLKAFSIAKRGQCPRSAFPKVFKIPRAARGRPLSSSSRSIDGHVRGP